MMSLFTVYRRLVLVMLCFFLLDGVVWREIVRSRERAREPTLFFFDVGQGDSSLIVLPGSVQILVDGGPPNRKLLTALRDALGTSDRYIDLVVMTHPQLDHFGGLLDALEKYEIGAFVGNGRAGETDAYRALREVLAAKRIPYVILGAGDSIRSGGGVMDVLAPTPRELRGAELNDTSIVFRLETYGMTALYTGDIGPRAEERLAGKDNIRANILKVPHHGSRFSSTALFLAAVKPQIATIGVGKNSYGHPTPTVIHRLRDMGVAVFRTDTDGTVRIERSGMKIEVVKKKRYGN